MKVTAQEETSVLGQISTDLPNGGIITPLRERTAIGRVLTFFKDKWNLLFDEAGKIKADYLPEMEISNPDAFTVTESQGAWNPGDVVALGASVWPTLKNVLSKVLYPTFSAPSATLSQNGGTLREIGSTHSTQVTLNFSKGSIMGALINNVWQANTAQNPRAGSASKYYIQDVATGNSSSISPGSDVASHAYTFSDRTIIEGYNNFSGYVEHLEGPQPVDSTGANYQAPLPATGTENPIVPTVVRYEGVFPIYASTSSITVGTKQALVSMLTGNNVLITLVTESGGNKQFFEIPDAWLNARPLADVEYFNAFTNAYDITGKLSDFTVSNNTRTLNGVQFGLKKFTYNGTDRGEQKIRLKF